MNPQRDPRWGRNNNSPGEDAYLEGEYGAQVVLGGQGAGPDGVYPLGDRRKAICEMKHFDAYRSLLPASLALRDYVVWTTLRTKRPFPTICGRRMSPHPAFVITLLIVC